MYDFRWGDFGVSSKPAPVQAHAPLASGESCPVAGVATSDMAIQPNTAAGNSHIHPQTSTDGKLDIFDFKWFMLNR